MEETNCGGPSAPSNIAPMSEHLAEMRALTARVEALEAWRESVNPTNAETVLWASAQQLVRENAELRTRVEILQASQDDRNEAHNRADAAEAKIRELEARPAGVPRELVQAYMNAVEPFQFRSDYEEKRFDGGRATITTYLEFAEPVPVEAPPAPEPAARPESREPSDEEIHEFMRSMREMSNNWHNSCADFGSAVRAFVRRFAPPVAVTWESLSGEQRLALEFYLRMLHEAMGTGRTALDARIDDLADAFHLDEAAARDGRAVPRKDGEK